MSIFKKTLVGILALITACGMLATGVFAEEVPVAAASEGEAAVAETTAADPIEGSWVLYAVYEVKEGAEPVLLKKEENQSLYGAGISIYTFEDGGYGHYNMIDADDNLDEEASWESTEPGTYSITETTGTVTMKYATEEDTLHKELQFDRRTLDFVYARAFVGSWKLSQVLEIHEGDAPVELSKEENQSLYAEDTNILTFFADKKAQDEVKEGPNAYMTVGTWEMAKPDEYVYKADGLEMTFEYFRVDDTLYRDVKEDSSEAGQPYLRFIYVRVETEETLAESEEEPATEPETEVTASGETVVPLTQTMYCTSEVGANVRAGASTDDRVLGGIAYGGPVNVTGKVTKDGKDTGWVQINFNGQNGYVNTANFTTTKPAEQPTTQAAEEKLPGDGQIFTGKTMIIYNPDFGGEYGKRVELLTDGRYADPEIGVTYEVEGGGGYHLYGSDGSVWVFEAYFAEFPPENDDELIADGQIFTGNQMQLYDEYGNLVTVSELNQGGWANEATGEIFYRGPAGGDFWYGDRGTTLSAEYN